MSVRVPCSRGMFALVDVADYAAVAAHKWTSVNGSRPGRTPYFCPRRQIRVGDKRRSISMAQFIMQPPVGVEVDHINNDPFDNRRCNLRFCTPTENKRNRRKYAIANRTSDFKGVRAHGAGWSVRIQVDGKLIPLGHFASEKDAARAYDRAAAELHGEFAQLNFPNEAEAA